MRVSLLALAACLAAAACSPRAAAPPAASSASAGPPSILLVTLDTTRADHVAPEAPEGSTPTLAGLAARGISFAHAYATAPMTLPAHVSMFTGLYPGGHGVHENGRRVPAERELLAPRLAALGYRTAAVVSGAPLESAAGLARGFERYDDDFGAGRPERDAAATTDRALEILPGLGEPAFLWVHYFDPHEPYAPPEPFRSRFAADPYRGEIAFLDRELGRLVAAFEARHAGRGTRLLIVGDHGEGRGDHGEEFHGNLLYQATMRVPLLIVDNSLPTPREIEHPVSARAVFDTVLGWARGEPSPGLLAAPPDLVLGEAMKPYLDYGWQPQVMALRGRHKAIQTGTVETELYDVVADPRETHDLTSSTPLDREVRQALREYPVPIPGGRTATMDSARSADLRELVRAPQPNPSSRSGGAPAATTDEAERQRLASLGYLVSSGPPPLRPDAPAPRRMTAVFPDLTLASGLFGAGRFAEAIPVFERILRADPGNVSTVLQLAAAHSGLGRDAAARAAFARARKLAPDSLDVRHYLGLHLLRVGALDEAERELAAVVAATPDRLPALEGLAEIRTRQGRSAEAEELWRRVLALDPDHRPALLAVGDAAMARGDTAAALEAFERARSLAPERFESDLQPERFERDLEPERFERDLQLGVLYLAARRLDEARASLDRVPPGHPGHPMALFKRAQVAVLIGEPDATERIRRARQGADETTRELIEREALFRSRSP